jgi:hypothetical protein
MKYATALSAKAMKVLNRLDQKIEHRIQSRFDELAVNPLDPSLLPGLSHIVDVAASVDLL